MKKISMLLLFAAMACGGEKAAQEAMKNAVLDVHDEVMPKMGQLMKLKKQLLSKANKIAENDTTDKRITELSSLANELESAHQGMMTWMHQWSENADPYTNGTAPSEEITAFYKAEQKKVNQVKADINGSIEKAQKALQ